MTDGLVPAVDLTFAIGDLVEPSLKGVMRLGLPAIQRGVVVGMETWCGRVMVNVHWDGYAAGMVAKLEPGFIQRRQRNNLL